MFSWSKVMGARLVKGKGAFRCFSRSSPNTRRRLGSGFVGYGEYRDILSCDSQVILPSCEEEEQGGGWSSSDDNY